MTSRFRERVARRPHLVRRGKGGVAGDVADLRADVLSVMNVLEVPPTNIRHVDVNTSVPTADQDGSFSRPYDKIQTAIDEFAALELEPSSMRMISIHPGTYPENLVIRTTMLRLHGLGGRDATLIIPSSGPAITITNATLTSLATYRGSSDYADLVYDDELAYSGAGPRDIHLDDIYWDDGSYSGNGMELLGVKGDASSTTTNFLDGGPGYVGFQTWRCYTSTAIFGRNIGYYQNEQTLIGATLSLANYGNIRLFNARGNAVVLEYDASSSYGNTAAASPNWFSFQFASLTDITLNKAARTKSGVVGFRSYSTVGDVTVNDTGIFTSAFNHIGGDLTCAAGASYDGVRDFIEGDLSFASGAGTASLIDGEYLGSVTDPDNKFEFGTPVRPGMTKEGGFAVTLTNKTGSNSVKGQIVEFSTSTDNAFDTAGTSSDDPIGIVYDDGIADGSPCRVVVAGMADVLMEDSTSVGRHDWISPGATTAGRATASSDPPGHVAGHWQEIGHAAEADAGGTDVLVRCLIHFN